MMNGVQFLVLVLAIVFFSGPSMTETNKLLEEIKTLLEIIEKRGRK